MCRAAFGDIPGVEVSDYEIRKADVSYTVQTLEHLAAPDRDIYLLCGTDMFLTLDRWYRAADIFRMAKMVCISRTEEKAEEIPEKMNEGEEEGTVEAVDVKAADALITDALAEALLMTEEREIYTEGSRRGVINVDTLSAAFLPGDEVDINRLKKKKLIARDVGYIKVLARGVVDKPLRVYANDFSLSAVKMIALSGGEAIKVITVRKKKGLRKTKNSAKD
jgi:ribosomal protein L15